MNIDYTIFDLKYQITMGLFGVKATDVAAFNCFSACLLFLHDGTLFMVV